jgi:hypothetical protein
VAEFVTMLYQSYYVLNGKPLPVNFADTITVNLGRTGMQNLILVFTSKRFSRFIQHRE